jgi:hypothetical protein
MIRFEQEGNLRGISRRLTGRNLKINLETTKSKVITLVQA